MVSFSDTAGLTVPARVPPDGRPHIATVGAAAAGGLVAIACVAMPSALLESLVVRSGVAALVNAAAPPLGLTARVLLATIGGVLAAAICWAVLVLALGERRVPVAMPRLRLPRRAAVGGAPSVRRADAHPDAPPRPPILAERDLGLPFLSVVAPPERTPAPRVPVPLAPAKPVAVAVVDERALPVDLDTALAAIDPDAIPAVPRTPVRPVPPLAAAVVPSVPARAVPAPPLAPGERIDSVELGAAVRDQPDSIESLLARLERGARRRPTGVAPMAPAPAPPPVREPRGGSLEETLGSLRRMATGS